MILRLSFLSLLLLGSWSFVAAQGPTDNLFIEGPQQLCLGECGTWQVFSTGIGQGASSVWVFQTAGAAGTVVYSDTLTSNTNTVTFCPPLAGVYRITVTALDPNGNVLFISQPAVVFVTEVTVAFYSATFLVESSCEQDTLTLFFPEEAPPCTPVCVGSQSTISLISLFGGYSDGTTFNYPLSTPGGGELNWVAQGGSLTYMGGTAQVIWDTPGSGSVQLNLLTLPNNSNSPCPTVLAPQLCFEVSPIPVAEISTQPPVDSSGVLTVCEGQSIAFEGQSGVADASFTWNFGDGDIASGTSISHTFATAGIYEVELISSSGCMCSDTAFLTVVVTGNEAPFVDCIGTLCAGETVTYTANTGCASYLWTVSSNGLLLAGGGPNDDFVTIQWLNGPEGEISLATDGCPDLNACTEVAFLAVPILDDLAEIRGRERACAGERVVYTITPFEGTTFEWTVSNFGIIESGQGTPSITVLWQDLGFVPSQAQWVRVNYNNCYLGCGGSDELVVNMLPFFRMSGPIEVCEGESATFEAFNQNGTTLGVVWSVLDPGGLVVWTGGLSASEPIPFNFGSGQFTVRATPPNLALVCNTYLEQNIRVYATPAPVDSIVGQRRICAGQNYTYRVHDSSSGDRFEWEINDGGNVSIQYGNPITYTWGASGSYSMRVSRLQRPPLNCSSVATTLNLSAVGAFTVNGPADVCKDEVSTFTTDLSGDADYVWSIMPASAGTITGSTTDLSIEVLWHEDGPAQVILAVCGQSASLITQVNTLPQPAVTNPAALCPGQTAVLGTSSLFDTYSWQDTAGLELAMTPSITLGPGYYQVQVSDANGCMGDTSFFIGEYPAASINITTPDFTIYCTEPPSAHLFAPNTDSGLSYQWLQNGSPIGASTADYVATALGVYQLRVTDSNGCEALSNTIELLVNCGGGGGGAPGGGAGCNNPAQNFAIIPGAFCNERSYLANAAGAIDFNWNFDDPASGIDNFSALPNPTHTYSRPGFYRVLLTATYADGTACRTIRPDTVLAAADFTFDPGCAGSAIDFTDISSFLPLTSITGWLWTFGDPASGSADTALVAQASHSYSLPGEYTVTLTIFTASGCQSRISKLVRVLPLPPVTFDAPMVNCEATALPFDALPTGELSFNWNFGEPASGEANTSERVNSFHAYAAPGSYQVALSGTDIFGCTQVFSRQIVVTPNLLSGDISPAGLSLICEGDSLLLSAPPGGLAWAWSNGDTTEQISVQEAGVYQLTLYNTDGCAYTPPAVSVEVVPAPVAPIRAIEFNENGQRVAYIYDTLRVCFGQDVFLETPLQTGYTWLWSTGDVTNSTSFTQDRSNLLSTGEHIITLQTTETATGCALLTRFVVVVHPAPDAPILTTNAPMPWCAGTPIDLQISNAQAGVTYLWSNGSSGTSIQTEDGGTYTAIALTTFGCRAEGNEITLLDGPNTSLVPSGCHTRCQPDTICLPTIPNIVSYQWFLDGSAVPGGSSPELIVNTSGSYTLEMTDADGCVQITDPLSLDLLPGFGTISGQVYFDVNENGLIDAGDTLVSSIPLVLLPAGGPPNSTTTTTIAGDYAFSNIPASAYTVQIDSLLLPEGWRAYTSSVDTLLAGCDQEVVLPWLLYLNCGLDTSFTVSVCPNESFSYEGQNLLPGSTTEFTLTSLTGCDSIVTLSVLALPTASSSLSLSTCPGSTVTYQGQSLAIGSSTPFTLVAANGCDSIVTVSVLALPTASSSLTLSACPGSTVTYQGQSLAIGSSTPFTLVAANGCDSIVTVSVQALPTATGSLSLSACPGSTATYQGQSLAIGSSTPFTLVAANGCDSIVTVSVQALSSGTTSLSPSVCPGENYTYLGLAYPAGTDTSFVFTNSQGCDSLVSLRVTASTPALLSVSTTDACPNQASGSALISASGGALPLSYSLDGISFQSSPNLSALGAGTYQLWVQDNLGCRFSQPLLIGAQPALLVELEDATLPCDGAAVTLSPIVISGDDGQLQYTWADGDFPSPRPVSSTGNYVLQVANACETLSLRAEVKPERSIETESLIYVPNAFSPNADGTNDDFRFFPAEDVVVERISLRIYDRWGGLVYQGDSANSSWNGRTGSQAAEQNVFVWILEADLLLCGQRTSIKKQGDVVLLR